MLMPPPERIVVDGAVARFGMFAGRIADPNLVEQRLPGLTGGLRLKQWQHLAVVHPDVLLSFAVVDVGYLKLGWVQLVDRRTGRREEHARKAPWLDLHVARALGDERSWLRSRGVSIALRSHLDASRHLAAVEAPGVKAELVCHATATPLEVVLPLGRGRAMWSHKVPLPTEGTLRWNGRSIDLDPAVTTTIFDIHKAHYPHRTWWKWGTFVGDAGGRRVAVNLTRNVVTDDALHENAVWVDGALALLPPPELQWERDPWSARGEGYALVFHGEGERREDLNAGLVVSRFRQRCGRWAGHVAGHTVAAGYGLAEDHVSAW